MARRWSRVMVANERKILRCAIYTRKSSEHGLEQDFNSLDAQRDAAEAYIKSQAHEGWKLIRTHYDDGGLSGGTLQRPALQSLLSDIRTHKIDVVVVYKVVLLQLFGNKFHVASMSRRAWRQTVTLSLRHFCRFTFVPRKNLLIECRID